MYDAADFKIEYKLCLVIRLCSGISPLWLSSEVEAGKLLDSVRETAGELLESVHVFDIYTGERLGADKKSVALIPCIPPCGADVDG